MKNITLSLAVILYGFISSSNVNAQSVAHMNYQNIIQLMPEYKSASEEYDLYRAAQEDQLKEIETEAMSLQKKIEMEQAKPQPVASKIKFWTTKLQEMQMTYQEMQQNIQDSLTNKMNELVEPLKKRIEAVVAEIAKEKGYTHVIDVSVVYMLYADPAYDITELVKAKLGIKDKPNANPGSGRSPIKQPGMGSQR